MQTRDLKVTDGAAIGAWIEPGLGGEFGAVTLQVPKGYEAYVRIFHAAGPAGGKPIRWAEVAEAMGRTAHREMQWESLIAGSSEWDGQAPNTGWIDVDDLDALCEILASHTSNPDQLLLRPLHHRMLGGVFRGRRAKAPSQAPLWSRPHRARRPTVSCRSDRARLVQIEFGPGDFLRPERRRAIA
jgi:hypothetical protein